MNDSPDLMISVLDRVLLSKVFNLPHDDAHSSIAACACSFIYSIYDKELLYLHEW